MFPILDKIDKALESKVKCSLLDKAGRHFNGTLTDSWVRLSGGKLRGKIKFHSEEKGEFEMDAYDILDIRFEKEKT